MWELTASCGGRARKKASTLASADAKRRWMHNAQKVAVVARILADRADARAQP